MLCHIPYPHIGRVVGGVECEGQTLAISRPGNLRYDALGQGRCRQGLTSIPTTRDIEQFEARVAILVGDEREMRAIIGERQALDIPWLVAQIGEFRGGEIEPGQGDELASTVAEQVEPTPIS